MANGFGCGRIAVCCSFGIGIIALAALWAGSLAAAEEDRKPDPCTEDAMIVFDASGSMSGNQTLGIPNSRPRIDEVRAALARVLPTATKHRRVGLITYGPGPYNQCNVKLDLKPTEDAFKPIMRAVNGLVPAGKTPLTSAVEQAAEVLSYRSKPGVIVLVTDGEETCGGAPCELAKQLRLLADQLTVHVIAFRYEHFSWTGGSSVVDLMCLADENRGIYARANTEEDLVEALEKTLDCPMISQKAPVSLIR
ncbi:MAG: VWA domain-containing protein [Methyloceanibacter sp.]